MEKETAESKRQKLRETLKQIHEGSSSVLSLSLQWKDLDEHYQTTRRFLESREKELDSVHEMIWEKAEELESKKCKFLLLESRVKERFGEVELKEIEVGVRLSEVDAKEKEIEERYKQVNLEKEKVEERLKELELREKELEFRERRFFGLKYQSQAKKKPFGNCLVDQSSSAVKERDQDLIQKQEAAEEKKRVCDNAKIKTQRRTRSKIDKEKSSTSSQPQQGSENKRPRTTDVSNHPATFDSAMQPQPPGLHQTAPLGHPPANYLPMNPYNNYMVPYYPTWWPWGGCIITRPAG